MNTCAAIIEENGFKVEYTLEQRINYVLSNLGIRHSMAGYTYLMEAIKMGIEDPESVTLITKILYIKLARKFQKKPGAIERNIRFAINSMPLSRYRTKVFCNNIDHYSNKEFIVHLVHYIQYGV